MTTILQGEARRSKNTLIISLVFVATAAFSVVFLWVNQLNFNWLSPLFESRENHTTWGIIQRLYLIIPLLAISIWRPRQVGFMVGKTFQYWKMLVVMLVLNVAVIAGYRILAGGTPYTGWDQLFNEVITVPLVEEVMWRGVIFSIVAATLRRWLFDSKAGTAAALITGVCFGLAHANNALFGYPLAFVALQTLNATIWGIVYGIARARTGSVFPPILFHAAMNLTVAI